MRTALKNAAYSVASQLRHMQKDDAPDNVAEEIVMSINLDALQDVEGAIVDGLIMVSQDAGRLSLNEIGVKDSSPMFGRASKTATAWARERAAELVTDITDSTRDMLRSYIGDAVEGGQTRAQMADELSSQYSFSDDRADLIVGTEIAFANGQGALEGYKAAEEAGVNVKKEWLLGPEPCEICQGNADDGPIDLDEEFSSGDDTSPAHPRCECTVSPVVEE